jgi:hypothetical protein
VNNFGDEILSPLNLNADPERYDGEYVVVSGYVTVLPDAHNIYQSLSLARDFERRWDADDDLSFDPNKYDKYCLTQVRHLAPRIGGFSRPVFNQNNHLAAHVAKALLCHVCSAWHLYKDLRDC